MTHKLLRAALQRAVKLDLIVRNPTDVVDAPSAPRREMKALTIEQIRTINWGTSPTGLIIQVVLHTGLRRGELLGLRWSDIDWRQKTLSVQRSIQVTNREMGVFPPKTERGRRLIALSDDALALFQHQKARQNEARLQAGMLWLDADWVFAQEQGRYMNPDVVSKSARTFLRARGFELSLHSLRHAHASIAFQLGIPGKVVSERLGHSSVSITLDIYSHVAPGMDATAAEAVARALG